MGNHPFLGLFLPQGLNYTNDGLPAGMNGTCSTVTFCAPFPRWRLSVSSNIAKSAPRVTGLV